MPCQSHLSQVTGQEVFSDVNQFRTVWRPPTHLHKFLKNCLDKMWVEKKTQTCLGKGRSVLTQVGEYSPPTGESSHSQAMVCKKWEAVRGERANENVSWKKLLVSSLEESGAAKQWHRCWTNAKCSAMLLRSFLFGMRFGEENLRGSCCSFYQSAWWLQQHIQSAPPLMLKAWADKMKWPIPTVQRNCMSFPQSWWESVAKEAVSWGKEALIQGLSHKTKHLCPRRERISNSSRHGV